MSGEKDERKRQLVAATWLLIASMVFLVIVVATGCGRPAQDPCQVNPTRTASDGRWVEADGEELDGDPCDSDDLEEDSKKKPKSKRTRR